MSWVILACMLCLIAMLWSWYRHSKNENIKGFFDTAIDGLVICKFNGELVRANPYFYKLLGFSERDLVGKSLVDHLHPEDKEATIKELSYLGNGGTAYDYVNRYVTKEGVTVHLMWRATSDPKTGLIYASARNITEKLRYEAQLKAVAYMASHDFAEPVRSISQFSSLLLNKEGDRLSDKGRRWLEKNIGESSKRLRSLSDDLRDYLKSMREDPVLEPIDLNEATQAAIELLNGAVEEAQATIEFHDLCSVYGTKQLQQVIYNLLSNAIKYVADDTKPVIQLSCEHESEYCTLHVRDNGIGFDPKFSDAIFDLGRRLYSSESKYWGSGTGLALVKLHVERMGGKVWATSTPGHGSCFSVRLRTA